MPSRENQPNTKQTAGADDRNAHLPSDRDEKSGEGPGSEAGNPQHDHNRKPIEQARQDVESGIQDTERIGTPNDVPASGDNR